MDNTNLIVTPIASMNDSKILGEYVDVKGEIVQFLSPFTGEEIEEGIMRVIRANLDAFGWIWVTGSMIHVMPEDKADHVEIIDGDATVDLDSIIVTGSWVITNYENYIPGMDLSPINIFTEYMGDFLYMISTVGTDIYYRVFSTEYMVWTDWIHQSFCEILTSETPPEEYEPNDLWLQPPTEDRTNYILYVNVEDIWIDITGNRVMYTEDYDPDRLQRNIFEYIHTMVRKKLCGLTDVNALKIPSLYLSDNYERIAFIQITDDFIYFFINKEDIKANMTLSQDHISIIRYDLDGTNPTVLDGPATNFKFLIYTIAKRFYGIGEDGILYDATNPSIWDRIENFVPRSDLATIYESPLMLEVNAEEIASPYEYGTIGYVKKGETGKVYFYTSSGDLFIEESDHNFTLYRATGIPSDFLIQDCKIYHNTIYLVGYNADGTPDTRYFKSFDDGIHWSKYDLPVSRLWSHLYTFDDELVASTDIVDTDIEPQTYGTKYREDKIDVWSIYRYQFGGVNVSDKDYIPVDIHVDGESGETLINITNEESTLMAKTTYDYLVRFLHDELTKYTYDEIKQLVKNALESYYQIVLTELKDRVDLDSFAGIADGQYGLIFKNDDGTLGFQSVYYATYVQGMRDHIHDESRHLTLADREAMLLFITRSDFVALHKQFKETLELYIDTELKKLIYTEAFQNANEQVETYLAHKADGKIHVSSDLRETFNSKAEGNHTHFLDNRVELDTSNIDGILPFDTIPPEAVKRMIKVSTIDEMLCLDKTKNHVYNGTCIRVLSARTKFSYLEKYTYREMEQYTWGELESIVDDPNEVLLGRFFWVVDCEHLNDIHAYLEFTMSDEVCVYWNEIVDRPKTKNGLDITDVPSDAELAEELTYHDKSSYGFEFLAADNTEAKLLQQTRVEAANDMLDAFQIENPPQNLGDNLTNMVKYMDNNPESIQKLNFGDMPIYKINDNAAAKIINFQYSPITKRYYITTYDTYYARYTIIAYNQDFKFLNIWENMVATDYGNSHLVFGIYRNIELYINPHAGKCILYNILFNTKTILPDDITIQSGNSIVYIDYVDQNSKPYFFINANLQLGIIKFTDDTKYTYRVFTNPISDIHGVTNILSMVYSITDDTLIVTGSVGVNGAVYTYKYYNLSVLVKSFDYFDEVDLYINGIGKNDAVTFVGEIPHRENVEFKSSYSIYRYYGKWDEKHIFIVRKDVDNVFYLAISDDFYSIPFVTLQITDKYINDVTLSVDMIPYAGKTYAICFENCNMYLSTKATQGAAVSTVIRFSRLDMYRIFRSDDIVCVDIATNTIIHNSDKSYIAKKSIPHTRGVYGIRYCNGCMYLFGNEADLIQFSPKAFFDQSITYERIHILSSLGQVHLNGTKRLYDNMPLNISDSNKYEGPIYNIGGYALNIQSICNIEKHQIANTALEYQVLNSSFTNWKIASVGTDGVVSAIWTQPSNGAYTPLILNYYSLDETLEINLEIRTRYARPYLYNSTWYGFDIFGNKINGVLKFTAIILDRTVNQFQIVYINADNTYTSETRSTVLDYTGDYEDIIVSFKMIKGFLLLSSGKGLYELYSVAADGIISTAPVLSSSSRTILPIKDTPYSVVWPTSSHMLEVQTEGIAYPSEFIDPDSNIIGYVYSPIIGNTGDSVQLNAICPIPKYMEIELGNDFKIRVLHLPYTKDLYRIICIGWSDMTTKLYIYAADDPAHYELFDVSLFTSIKNISYIMAKNSLVNEESYGYILIEAFVEGENGKVQLNTIDGTAKTLYKAPYSLYYIPVSTSAIMDIFRSNFAQLQKSSSSVYAKIDAVMQHLDELF